LRQAAVAAAIHGDHERVVEAAGEARAGGVRQMVIDELDRAGIPNSCASIRRIARRRCAKTGVRLLGGTVSIKEPSWLATAWTDFLTRLSSP
jgi:hypothetical protein